MNRVRCMVIGCLLISAAGASIAPASAQMPSSFDLHERVDPISGLRWVEVHDSTHPAAPPRLMRAREPEQKMATRADSSAHSRSDCVHAGDRLRIESATRSGGTITLEARAITGGVCGGRLRARIVVTGATVDAAVSAPGTASLVGRWDGAQ